MLRQRHYIGYDIFGYVKRDGIDSNSHIAVNLIFGKETITYFFLFQPLILH